MATTRARRRRVKKKPEITEEGYIIEEEEEEEISSNTSFDVSKYTIGTSSKDVTLLVGPDEDELKLKVKNLSWSKRNRIMSSCLTWNAEGNTNFDGDAYVRLCLKEMIVEAPWGPTTESFLVRIDASLGKALESLVPQAFEGEQDMVDEVDDLKKEQ